MAMACLREWTVPPLPPLPDFSVPRFSRCMARSTLFAAAGPYLRVRDFLFEEDFFAGMFALLCVRGRNAANRVQRSAEGSEDICGGNNFGGCETKSKYIPQ